MKRLVVIDGKSVFYRGYYAMPGLSTADGTPTGGGDGVGGFDRQVLGTESFGSGWVRGVGD